jgi:hypothetical protein
MPHRFKLFAVLLLVLLLLPAALQAAETRQDAAPGSVWGLLLQAWSFFTGAWSDNGCGLDPDGRCLAGQGTATADNGCGLDPNGRCLAGQGATATADNGCGADPDGRCGR